MMSRALRVIEPALARWQVHGAQLPLAERIADARLEATPLLLVAHLQPYLDQLNAAVHDELLDQGAQFQETPVLLLGAEAHDVLHPGAVVPAPVEDDDFPRGGKMRKIALQVHLRLLAVRRRGQRDHAKHPGAHPLRDGADRTPLAGGIPTLEDDDHA
jgi:hypothetical protein